MGQETSKSEMIDITDVKQLAEEIVTEREAAIARDPIILSAISIAKDFLRRNDLIGYGGTALNFALPEELRFYDFSKKLPDMDEYTTTPHLHAKQLADELYSKLKRKFTPAPLVTVRPGMKPGVLKVEVNYQSIMDTTYLPKQIFEKQIETGFTFDGMKFVSHELLRWALYKELAYPAGDVSRWGKVYSRLLLFSKAFPIMKTATTECSIPSMLELRIRDRVLRFLKEGKGKVVLLGMTAVQWHDNSKNRVWRMPIDLLTAQEDAKSVAKQLCKIIPGSRMHFTQGYDETVPSYYKITSSAGSAAKPISLRLFTTPVCRSYQMIDDVPVGSIPTLMTVALSSRVSTRPVDEADNGMLCVADDLIQRTLLPQTRTNNHLVSSMCVGNSEGIAHIIDFKSKVFDMLQKCKDQFRADRIRTLFFFKYNPAIGLPPHILSLLQTMDYSLLEPQYVTQYLSK